MPSMFFTITGWLLLLVLSGCGVGSSLAAIWFNYVFGGRRVPAVPIVILLLCGTLFCAVFINSPFTVAVAPR